MTEEQIVAHEERAAVDPAEEERRLIVAYIERSRDAERAIQAAARFSTHRLCARERAGALSDLLGEIERGEHRSGRDG